ncbi:DUF86 domain-containing protein [Desulfurobacterium sp.]
MEKFRRAVERFEKAFRKFKEIVESESLKEFFKEEFLIEITTKRFEYTYEAMWKASKEFLRLNGIECNSPRSCFRELIKEGIIPEKFEKILSNMIILRNQLVHVYDEAAAKTIYTEITRPEILKTFETVLKNLSK